MFHKNRGVPVAVSSSINPTIIPMSTTKIEDDFTLTPIVIMPYNILYFEEAQIETPKYPKGIIVTKVHFNNGKEILARGTIVDNYTKLLNQFYTEGV